MADWPWPFNIDAEESRAIFAEVLDELPDWMRAAIVQRIGAKALQRRLLLDQAIEPGEHGPHGPTGPYCNLDDVRAQRGFTRA